MPDQDPQVEVSPPSTVSGLETPPVEPNDSLDHQEKPKGADWTDRWGINTNLPPLHDYDNIFADIARKALDNGLASALTHLNGRKLRVATMCSGTDCPLIALRMIKNELQKIWKKPLNVEHVFSAEIEAIKQAFIARNFPSLPIIFRDVREIAQSRDGNDPVTTAYGSPEKVPGHVDLLVAGFACVEWSKLNTAPKTAEDVGESEDTLTAILTYALNLRPAIVLFENVIGAPWPRILQRIRDQTRYSPRKINLDTKNYYIPQTRNRGYLIMVDQDRAGGVEAANTMANKWASALKAFERPASSPIEEFLLDSDDPRVHKAHNELRSDTKGMETDWTLSRGRHHKVRVRYQLGSRRPITNWVEGGRCTFPDFGSMSWFNGQVHRVLDSIDINFLRSLHRGFHAEYKFRYWNLSQNVDRETDTGPFGMIGCLTPRGLPYSTMRGGPIIGLEALIAQGIPASEIVTTRETEAELLDLAGNAMTSTVVGVAMICALISAWPILDSGKGDDIKTSTDGCRLNEMRLDHLQAEQTIDLFTYNSLDLYNTLQNAHRSIRLCHCEGQNEMSKRAIQRCLRCGHTACQRCTGIPPHDYEWSGSRITTSRVKPGLFREDIRRTLPMMLRILVDLELVPSYSYEGAEWDRFHKVVDLSIGEGLRYHSEQRAHEWTMIYKGVSSRLELKVSEGGAAWYLYCEPSKELTGNDPLRALLRNPVARMYPPALEKPFNGSWHFCVVPQVINFHIVITGCGELIRSWRSKQGLEDSGSANEKVWEGLTVAYADSPCVELDEEICGIYELLQDCGTSFGSLHKKVASEGENPVFLFHDPDPYGRIRDDSFVFATTTHRLKYGERRQIIAQVEPSWKPSHAASSTVQCKVQGKWVHTPAARLEANGEVEKPIARIVSSELKANVHEPISHRWRKLHQAYNCSAATTAILTCKVPLQQDQFSTWSSDSWQTVTAGKEQASVSTFMWLLEKVKALNNFPNTWNQVPVPYDIIRCPSCVPKTPELRWKRLIKNKQMSIIPEEDPGQAANFEHIMKARPNPFLVQTRSDEKGYGWLRIGLNIATLAHRAVAKFADRVNDASLNVRWRLETLYKYPSQPRFHPFKLSNNHGDDELPHQFVGGLELRAAQRRSFRWMVGREENPSSFLEQETEEAVIRELGWRATAQARRSCGCRGGALTDGVGYGKTVLILALIDRRKPSDEQHATFDCTRHILDFDRHVKPSLRQDFSDFKEHVSLRRGGHIPIKATLVVVQPTLVDQWKEQIIQFLGNQYKLLIIDDIESLRSATIRDYRNADIVLVSWSVLDEKEYSDRLSLFGAVPEGPDSGGRAYDTWLKHSYRSVMEKVQQLRNTTNFWQYAADLQSELDENECDQDLNRQAASKRLRGKAYVEAKKKKERAKPVEVDEDHEKPGVKWAARPTKIKDFNMHRAESMDDIKGVALNLFCWARNVTDEYPFASNKAASIIAELQAQFRWILSATPTLNVFDDVKRLARFLGVNLGIDDDSSLAMGAKALKRYRQERTSAEMFQSFVHLSSPTWHEERHRHAQRFLHDFARQNDTVLDDMECSNYQVLVEMAPIEQAIYMELAQQLHGQDMKVVRSSGSRSDSERVLRMDQILRGSQSGEEALILSATRFRHDVQNNEPASTQLVHQSMLKTRSDQYGELVEEVRKALDHAEWLLKQCRATLKSEEQYEGYLGLRDYLCDGSFGDEEAMQNVQEALACVVPNASLYDPAAYYKNDRSKKPRKLPQIPDDYKKEMRHFAGELRKIITECVARRRALRYFTNVRGLQMRKAGYPEEHGFLSCDRCKEQKPVEELAVLGICGHVGCKACLDDPERSGNCIVSWCTATAEANHIHRGGDLHADTTSTTSQGSKIDAIIYLVCNHIHADQQVLVFVQNDTIGHEIQEAFERAGISFISLLEYTKDPRITSGFRKIPQKALGKRMSLFQTSTRVVAQQTRGRRRNQAPNDWRKCLVLNAFSEAAAGA